MGACCNAKEHRGIVLNEEDGRQADLTMGREEPVEECNAKPVEGAEKETDADEIRFREQASQMVSPNETTNVAQGSDFSIDDCDQSASIRV
jgi:hypothetical protein